MDTGAGMYGFILLADVGLFASGSVIVFVDLLNNGCIVWIVESRYHIFYLRCTEN